MNGEVFCFDAVAPVRERGLKYPDHKLHRASSRRSRKGAWIEIKNRSWLAPIGSRRSRKGAWIEIST